jgi:hypothetical protein
VADAQPPKKPGPGRWILLGCGLLTGLFILGMGSCAGIMYFVYKGTDPVAEVGAEYLRKSTKVQDALGPPVVVERHRFGWNVHVVNDGGNARITYTARGSRGEGEAMVWLVRNGGKWSAVGARIPKKDLAIGKPPSEHHIKWDD